MRRSRKEAAPLHLLIVAVAYCVNPLALNTLPILFSHIRIKYVSPKKPQEKTYKICGISFIFRRPGDSGARSDTQCYNHYFRYASRLLHLCYIAI